jgi:multimeric flavodoxin WrbA
MKTLIINGSPRKNGGTSGIVHKLAELLSGETEIINTYSCGVQPCIDCRYCWTHNGCSVQDPMQDIYKKINDADNIIIASPIYFAELTGSLLSWASRLQYFWTARNFRNDEVLQPKDRFGAVILVDGGEGVYENALAMGKRMLRIMSAEYKELIYYSGTDKEKPQNPSDDSETVDKIKKLADLLNSKAG